MANPAFIAPMSVLLTCIVVGAARGQAPATRPVSVFAEIVLEDPRNRSAKCYLDLDTGRTFTYGESMPENFAASRKWTVDNGVDLMCETDAPSKGFAAFDLSLIDARGAFDAINDYSAATEKLKAAGEPKPFELLTVGQSLPRTYLLKTREGGIAVLEVMEFTTQPSGIRVRVKALSKPPPQELPLARGAGRGPRVAAAAARVAPVPAAQQINIGQQAADQERALSQAIQLMTGTLGERHPVVIAARARLASISELAARTKQFTDPQMPLLQRREDLQRQITAAKAAMEKQAESLSQLQKELREVQAEIEKAQVAQPPATRP